jgi:hypothetical protein
MLATRGTSRRTAMSRISCCTTSTLAERALSARPRWVSVSNSTAGLLTAARAAGTGTKSSGPRSRSPAGSADLSSRGSLARNWEASGRRTELPRHGWRCTKLAETYGTSTADEAAFGVFLDLEVPPSTGPGVRPELLKTVLDGVVCAFQTHVDETTVHDMVSRIADELNVDPNDVAQNLLASGRAVLGARHQLVHRRGVGVQWNPSDHLCVAGQLLRSRGTDGGCAERSTGSRRRTRRGQADPPGSRRWSIPFSGSKAAENARCSGSTSSVGHDAVVPRACRPHTRG